jgi:predicted glycosyltransferase
MARRRRFLIYSQHLSGTGHFVRAFEIARALAAGHEVCLLEGGRPVRRPRPAYPFAVLPVPPICRTASGIVPVDPGRPTADVMRERGQLLRDAVERFRPDVLLVEHFPFSKWELAGEIVSLIERARVVNRSLRVACSVRDIVGRSRREAEPEQHRCDVVQMFDSYFHALLVHADLEVTRLHDHVPWADQLGVPIVHTGYVSEKLSRPSTRPAGQPLVIASAGGASAPSFLSTCLEAWTQLEAHELLRSHQLVVFLPPSLTRDSGVGTKRHAAGSRIRLRRFTSHFLAWMRRARLSISQAGYNTCTNLLETRTRGVLVPNPAMSDQVPRARLLAGRSLAHVIDPSELSPGKLAQAVVAMLRAPGPAHDLDLNGAEKTRQVLEQL